jgi:hypothetical protein
MQSEHPLPAQAYCGQPDAPPAHKMAEQRTGDAVPASDVAAAHNLCP